MQESRPNLKDKLATLRRLGTPQNTAQTSKQVDHCEMFKHEPWSMTYTLKTDLTLRGRYLTQTQAEYHSIGQSQSNLIKTTYVTSNVQVTKGLVTQLLIEPNAGNRAVFPTEYLFEAVAEAKRPCPHAPHQGNVSTSPRFLWHLFTVSVPITHLVYDLILYMPACPCSSSRSAPARRSVRFMPSCCITHARLFVQLLLVVPSGSCRLSLRVMPVFPSGSCSSCCPAPARRLVRFIPSTYLPGSCPCIYPASSRARTLSSPSLRLKPVYLSGFFRGQQPSPPLSGPR